LICAKQIGASLHGRVIDARSGEPIAKVKLNIVGAAQSATTDEHGTFRFQDLQPGELSLYITTVGYGLVKKAITVKQGDNAGVEIALNQEAATLTDQVTVTAETYGVTETNAASEKTLNKTELQELSKVVISDPLRAVQALPGVTANDDLHAEFAVRGADYRRVGVYVDGILTDNFLHFIQGNGPEHVSLSVINTETLREVSLLSGAFPAKYGDSTAAVLNLGTRDGNRVKPTFRFTTGLQIGTSGVADGPLAGKRGTWLVAARSSLLDYVARLADKVADGNSDPDADNVDFNDVQGKGVYDFTAKHQVGVASFLSVLNLDEAQNQAANPNLVFKARSYNLLTSVFWNYTPNAQFFAQTRVFRTRTNLKYTNQGEAIISDRPRTQFGLRTDLNFLARPAHRFEGGLYVREITATKITSIFPTLPAGAPQALERFNKHTVEQGYYLQDTFTNARSGFSMTGGARVDHNSLTGETRFSPRAAFAQSLGNRWTIRAGFGRYYQFPDFAFLFGQLGNPNLRAERATHYNASVERTFGNRFRILAEVYDREDRDLFFSFAEPRLESNQVTVARFPFRNSLLGYARGIELTLQRRSANRLSGWISYSYAQTGLRDEQSGLKFVSDFDQRHTVNLYESYRFTETFNVSGQWRYGSGLPIPGFFSSSGADLVLASARNLVRLPAYSRVDMRANKAFFFEKWKLTLSIELLNVTNHRNLRYPVIDGLNMITGRISYRFGDTMKVLPAVGISIEF
jgi:outer membrane cobalamin receptor